MKVLKLASVLSLLPAAMLLVIIAFSSMPATSAQETPNIQAPLLTKTVRLDGKISGTEEWSDVTGTSLTIPCTSKQCNQAPIPNVQAVVWIKHDGKWLYFLYRVDWPKALIDPTFAGEAVVEYYWTPGQGVPIRGQWLYEDANYVVVGYDESRGTVNPTWTGTDDWWVINGSDYRDEEYTPPGRNDLQGIATHDGEHYWFEFRKPLNSGDGCDWNFTVGNSYGVLGLDGLLQVGFGTSKPRIRYYQPITLTLLNSRTILTSVTTASSIITSVTTVGSASVTTGVTTSSSSAETAGAPAFAIVPFGNFGLVGLIAVVVLVSSVLVLRSRRKPAQQTVILKESEEPKPEKKSLVEEPAGPAEMVISREPVPAVKPLEPVAKIIMPPVREREAPTRTETVISTGYADLDSLLSGGLPEGYAVLFASPSYDERDLLLRRIVESNLSPDNPVFYISSDVRRTKDLLDRYPENFYAFCPQADKIPAAPANLFKMGGVENLSDFNISLTMAQRGIQVEQGARKIMVVDVLSDVLLRHKMLTTRRWLSDFLAKRKAEGFTILATFNPLIAAKEETQTIFDSFDGVVEIYEKELKERSRRFLTIRKMYGRRYSESELMLDKDKLF